MKLTKKEAKVYEALQGSQVVTRATLLNLVWGFPTDMAEKVAKTSRTVDMTVSRLNKKLPKGMTVESRHGIGYTLNVG